MVSEDQSQGPENSRASTISTMLGPPKRLAPLPNVIVVVAHFFYVAKGPEFGVKPLDLLSLDS